MADASTRHCYIVEYFDQAAAMNRRYSLLYWPGDSSVEMYDLKTKRMFLKRCPYPSLTLRDLFVGATVTVFGRSLKIVDFGDEHTRRLNVTVSERAILVIGGSSLYKVGSLITQIMTCDVRVHNIRLCHFGDATQAALKCPHARVYVIEVIGGGLTSTDGKLASLASADLQIVTDPAAIDNYRYAAFVEPECTATFRSNAVCVIKPHAVNEHAGTIVQRILDEGFEITALGAFTLCRADAEDFLEVYEGVVPEYKGLVDHLSSGQLWAMEVHAENSVPALRAVCGPHDPEICRVLYPDTIRSQLGADRVRNAVHCTDLPEDGPLESEFFFKLLAGKA